MKAIRVVIEVDEVPKLAFESYITQDAIEDNMAETVLKRRFELIAKAIVEVINNEEN